MYRLLAMSLVALALLVGYSIREPKVSAQTSSLPYHAGDSVRLEYPDGLSRGTCVIEQFYGPFISCKVQSRGFVAPDAPPSVIYNLNTVISIHLLNKAQ
jgi:hypothetical protein